MVISIMLDTSAVIDLINKSDSKVISAIKKENPIEVVIPSIVKYELEAVVVTNPNREIDFPCVSFSCSAASLAAQMMMSLESKGKRPSLKDCFIAASAIKENCLLITLDKDFKIFTEFELKFDLVKES